MPDRPAPPHSTALAAATYEQPELEAPHEPEPVTRTWASREEHAAYLAGLRRKGAARARARREAA